MVLGYPITGSLLAGDAANQGDYEVCRFILAAQDTFTSISVYFNQPTAGGTIYCFIYDSSGNLVAVTSGDVLAAGAGWQTFNLSNPVVLPPGTYDIGFVADVLTYLYYDAGDTADQHGYNEGIAFGTPVTPEPYMNRNAYVMSIYASTQAAGVLTVNVSPPSASIVLPNSAIFTAMAAGGTPGYTYEWIDNTSGTIIGTGATYTFTPTVAGTYAIYARVTDSTLATANSNVVTITVTAGILTYTLTINSTPISGVPFTLTPV